MVRFGDRRDASSIRPEELAATRVWIDVWNRLSIRIVQNNVMDSDRWCKNGRRSHEVRLINKVNVIMSATNNLVNSITLQIVSNVTCQWNVHQRKFEFKNHCSQLPWKVRMLKMFLNYLMMSLRDFIS
jgi:hypothetical protein